MSKIANREIKIPNEVSLTYPARENELLVSGPKGSLSKEIPKSVLLEINSGILKTIYSGEIKNRRKELPIVGTYNSLISSMIFGVISGYTKKFELKGIGYRVIFDSNERKLTFSLGFHDNKILEVPEYIEIDCSSHREFSIFCLDKQKMGLFSFKIKSLRARSAYKLVGIFVDGESTKIKLKKGKTK